MTKAIVTPLVIVVVLVEYVSCYDHHHVIVDTDPGLDDTLAILTLLGDPSVTVEAITVVRGNGGDVWTEVRNLYKTLYVAADLQIPVYKGNNYGLVDTRPTDKFFGDDGFGDLGNELTYDPAWETMVHTEHPASFMARKVRENPGKFTIVALGPLTNLALALSLSPEFLNQTRSVFISGGTVHGVGNVKPGIEFNFYLDPEAARVVLARAEACSRDVFLVPVETVASCDLGIVWRLFEVSELNNNVTRFIDKLESKFRTLHPELNEIYHPFDVFPAVALVNPASVGDAARYYGAVETGGALTSGMLVIDHNAKLNRSANLVVITAMVRDELRKTIIQSWSSYSDY